MSRPAVIATVQNAADTANSARARGVSMAASGAVVPLKTRRMNRCCTATASSTQPSFTRKVVFLTKPTGAVANSTSPDTRLTTKPPTMSGKNDRSGAIGSFGANPVIRSPMITTGPSRNTRPSVCSER